MGEAVHDVSLVAQALEAAGVVDAGVVTGSLKGALINVWGRPERHKAAEKYCKYCHGKDGKEKTEKPVSATAIVISDLVS